MDSGQFFSREPGVNSWEPGVVGRMSGILFAPSVPSLGRGQGTGDEATCDTSELVEATHEEGRMNAGMRKCGNV